MTEGSIGSSAECGNIWSVFESWAGILRVHCMVKRSHTTRCHSVPIDEKTLVPGWSGVHHGLFIGQAANLLIGGPLLRQHSGSKARQARNKTRRIGDRCRLRCSVLPAICLNAVYGHAWTPHLAVRSPGFSQPFRLTAGLRTRPNHLKVDHVGNYIDSIVSFQAWEVAILEFPRGKRNDGTSSAHLSGTEAFARLGRYPAEMRFLAKNRHFSAIWDGEVPCEQPRRAIVPPRRQVI